MKSFSFLFALLSLSLPFCLANSQDSAHQKLVELANAGDGVIKLDPKTFDLLISPKRNWSAAIQLTALDQRRRCMPCKAFDPAWKAVAKAWTAAPKHHRDNHFFATLDFDDGQAVFQKLGLTSAPTVHVYPATVGPRAPANGRVSPSTYDFSNGYEAAPLAAALSKHTPITIPYKDPIDWAYWGTITAGLLGLAVLVRFIAPILQSRWSWAVVTVVVSLVMTSGYMFTRIRGSPYTGGDGHWIASGFQNQFGQEVSVVAFVYGLLACSFLMLIVVVPYQTSPQRQRVQVYLWMGVILIIYSILVSLFRVKNRGYPFRLFL